MLSKWSAEGLATAADRAGKLERELMRPLARANAGAPDREALYAAFCGIGRPEKFRETILAQGLKLEEWRAYPDHHPFTTAELRALDEQRFIQRCQGLKR